MRPDDSPAESRYRATLLVLGLTTAVAMVAYIGIGASAPLPFGQIVSEILRGPGKASSANVITWDIRLPRGLLCLISGWILAGVGSSFQALLRNPLADPFIIGVSSGAGVGGAIAIAAGFAGAFFGLGMMAACFAGGLLSLALVFALSRRQRVVNVASLLLAGVATGSLLSALLSFILMLGGQDTTRILGFLLGHTSDASWSKVSVVAIATIGFVWLGRQLRALNLLALGEVSAKRMGVRADYVRNVTLSVGTAMTAAVVGCIGIVGFVGLLGPHIARSWVGVDWRRSLPVAVMIGGLLMVVSDLIAQRLLPWLTGAAGMEVNVGIVAALLGAPTLLILLRREERSY